MQLFLAAQLAWSNTTYDWQRLFVRCAGITFAVVLMFLQTGFRNALFDSNVRIMEEKIDADIVIRSASRFMLSSGQTLPLEDVIAAQSCEGVASAEPLYIEKTISDLRKIGFFARKIRVLAFDPHSEMFAAFGVKQLAHSLQIDETAAADTKSKPMFGLPENADELKLDSAPGGAKFELAGKQVHIVGLFENGIDFSNDGNLIMTPRNFAAYFSMRGAGQPLSKVDYGVIRCAVGDDPSRVVKRLRQLLGPDVIVETRANFLRSERNFWSGNTPIGLIFWVGTVIGFAVGMIICYQVLATDISDHISEFATLKAMGYQAPFFAAVVIVQALLLSLASFGPGLLITLLAFEAVNLGTGLVMFLNASRIGLVLGLTVLMCVLSGMIALRKLLSADPATLF